MLPISLWVKAKFLSKNNKVLCDLQPLSPSHFLTRYLLLFLRLTLLQSHWTYHSLTIPNILSCKVFALANKMLLAGFLHGLPTVSFTSGLWLNVTFSERSSLAILIKLEFHLQYWLSIFPALFFPEQSSPFTTPYISLYIYHIYYLSLPLQHKLPESRDFCHLLFAILFVVIFWFQKSDWYIEGAQYTWI